MNREQIDTALFLRNHGHSWRSISKSLKIPISTIRYHLQHGNHLKLADQKRRERGSRINHCGLCGEPGHNSQTCGVER